MIRDFNVHTDYDDAYQESLILLYDAFLRYDINSKYPFYSYFKKSLRNRLIDFKKKNSNSLITYEVDYDLSILKEETELDYERELSLPLSILSTKQRKVLELRYLEGKSPQEIADIYGVSVGNIYSTLHSAKKKLRSRLCEEDTLF